MSYPGQNHHPHTRGEPPNLSLIGTDREAPYIPVGLELVQAHWFVRHGERAPVRRRLVGVAGIPPVFPLCAVGREFAQAVLKFPTPASSDRSSGLAFEGEVVGGEEGLQKVMGGSVIGNEGEPVKGRLEVRRLTQEQGVGNVPVAGSLADCYWGELTDLGRQSTLTLGTALRSLYVDQLKFLPSTLPDLPLSTNPITFRSTGMPRTIETLHQLAVGLFPDGKRAGAVEYTVRNPQDESLYPNSLCAKMRRLDRASAEEVAKTYNGTLIPLDEKLSKYVDGNPIRIDGHPRANGILDTIMVCRAHGIKVPVEFEDVKTLETLETAVVHEWFDAYKHLEFKKLSMGRLLGDLKASIESKLADPKEKENKLRLALYACHDTSLGGILNALDAFDSRWPPFTSHISFEVLKKSTPPSLLSNLVPSSLSPSLGKDHYIRMRYNARNIVLPACKPVGKHLEGSNGEVCTFEAFREAVEKVEIGGKEWEEGCV